MATSKPKAPSNLKERIAALQQRNVSPPSQSSNSLQPPLPNGAGLRDKIAKFESKGGVPVPRGSFGMGAPPLENMQSRRKGELYGNRIPSVPGVQPGARLVMHHTGSALNNSMPVQPPSDKRRFSMSADINLSQFDPTAIPSSPPESHVDLPSFPGTPLLTPQLHLTTTAEDGREYEDNMEFVEKAAIQKGTFDELPVGLDQPDLYITSSPPPILITPDGESSHSIEAHLQASSEDQSSCLPPSAISNPADDEAPLSNVILDRPTERHHPGEDDGIAQTLGVLERASPAAFDDQDTARGAKFTENVSDVPLTQHSEEDDIAPEDSGNTAPSESNTPVQMSPESNTRDTVLQDTALDGDVNGDGPVTDATMTEPNALLNANSASMDDPALTQAAGEVLLDEVDAHRIAAELLNPQLVPTTNDSYNPESSLETQDSAALMSNELAFIEEPPVIQKRSTRENIQSHSSSSTPSSISHAPSTPSESDLTPTSETTQEQPSPTLQCTVPAQSRTHSESLDSEMAYTQDYSHSRSRTTPSYTEPGLESHDENKPYSFSVVVRGKSAEPNGHTSTKAFPSTPQVARIRKAALPETPASPGFRDLAQLVQETALLEELLADGEFPSERPPVETEVQTDVPVDEAPAIVNMVALAARPIKKKRSLKNPLGRNKTTGALKAEPPVPPLVIPPIPPQSGPKRSIARELVIGRSTTSPPSHSRPSASIPRPPSAASLGDTIDDLPPTPPPKSSTNKYFSSLRKLGSQSSNRSGTSPKHTSASSLVSSEDSPQLATPFDDSVEFASKQSRPASVYAWSPGSPKRVGGSMLRASSFAEKMWHRTRTRSTVSSVDVPASPGGIRNLEPLPAVPLLPSFHLREPSSGSPTSMTEGDHKRPSHPPPRSSSLQSHPRLEVSLTPPKKVTDRPQSTLSVYSTASSSVAPSPFLDMDFFDSFPAVPENLPSTSPSLTNGGERTGS